MKIIFARHGQTISGSLRKYEGLSNSPLTDLGRKQAEKVGQYCIQKKIKRIISSPLARALETAGIIGNILKLKPEVENRIKEVCYGNWETKARDDLMKDRSWTKRKNHPFTFIYPGSYRDHNGESYKQQYKRALPFIEEMVHSISNTVIICHIGILRCILLYTHAISQDTYTDRDIMNSQIIELLTKDSSIVEYKMISL